MKRQIHYIVRDAAENIIGVDDESTIDSSIEKEYNSESTEISDSNYDDSFITSTDSRPPSSESFVTSSSFGVSFLSESSRPPSTTDDSDVVYIPSYMTTFTFGTGVTFISRENPNQSFDTE